MTLKMKSKRVTICSCASRSFIDKDKVLQVATLLKDNGSDVRIEADLCKMVMNNDPDMHKIASSVILACYPRAVRSLLATMDLVPERVLDIRNGGVAALVGQLQVDVTGQPEKRDEKIQQKIKELQVEDGTDAWYPVLDRERCTDCGKCHDFCLFGVYAWENKKVKTVSPQNCKNNCPACARMCPTKAIIFPKYEKSPINGGLDEEEQFNPQEMHLLYLERLRYKLKERKGRIPLLKGD